jgi:hypothetical protein
MQFNAFFEGIIPQVRYYCGADRHTRPIFKEADMNPLFSKGDPKSFLHLFKMAMERDIRAQFSEHVIMQVHDALYAPIKQVITQVPDAIEAELAEAFGNVQNSPSRRHQDMAIAMLRTLLDNNAKERDLQNALLNSGLLDLTNCKVIQEVVIAPTSSSAIELRMDLVLEPDTDDPIQVIELKRGSHLLLAHQGKPTERLSKALAKATKQVKGYGDRLVSDSEAVESIDIRDGIKIEKLELRLVAGRRPLDASGYSLLSLEESKNSNSDFSLQIYSWDGFLAELERIAS